MLIVELNKGVAMHIEFSKTAVLKIFCNIDIPFESVKPSRLNIQKGKHFENGFIPKAGEVGEFQVRGSICTTSERIPPKN